LENTSGTVRYQSYAYLATQNSANTEFNPASDPN
jgi:hypothetical protein